MYPKEFTADVDACPQFSQERVCEISPDGQGLILRPMSLCEIFLIQRAWYLSLALHVHLIANSVYGFLQMSLLSSNTLAKFCT